ncbi:hypothetical protein F2Q68_00035646 [Brassica cretica]|uniref:Uncharacterized protein n=1 Tax=Brassica cretica TaxID=69181 RepID=A0A8S9GZI4_BRACR|nr:hypothetical protein F2Q68_00035646 [Brassica cretica]
MCQRIIDSGIDSWLGISVERIRESQPRIMGVDWSYDIHGPDAGREGSGSNKKKRAETEQSEDVLPDYSETFAEDIVPAAGDDHGSASLNGSRPRLPTDNLISEDPPTKRAKRPSVFLAPFCSYYFFYIIEICFDQNKLRQNFLPDFGDFM